jgi:hypothetical protein
MWFSGVAAVKNQQISGVSASLKRKVRTGLWVGKGGKYGEMTVTDRRFARVLLLS